MNYKLISGKIHIIQHQSIEITFDGLDDSFSLQNQIADVFYAKLQPRMEVLFDELFGKNQYASIDKLEIDCGLLNLKNWEQEFAEEAIRKMKEELLQVNKKEIDFKKIEETMAAETFFFFLENGFLPWNKRIDSLAEFEQLISINEKLVSKLKKLISQKEKVAERLTSQFSKKFTAKIIAEISKGKKNELDEIFSLLEKLNTRYIDKLIDKRIVDAVILKVFADDESIKITQDFFTILLLKVERDAELKSEIKEILRLLHVNEGAIDLATLDYKQELGKKEKEEKQESNEKEKVEQEKDAKKDRDEKENPHDSIYINNVGLVLLHPFLQTLFEHLKLTEENRWIDENSQHKAVLILEFLATGKDEVEEFTLMLNKILCGIDIDEIVKAEKQLDDEIKFECEVLLNDVIKHWSVLRNTSIAGLRETFLQRNGKLSKVDNGWLLQVEQKAVDILLGHLPWGIGLIKLPWMDELLYVEWA